MNNAAIISFEELAKADLGITNVLGPITLTHLFLPDLLASNDGRIVNIGSPKAQVASSNRARRTIFFKIEPRLQSPKTPHIRLVTKR